MPIYEYTCPKCKKTFEEWLKVSETRETAPCPVCGAEAPHIISNTAFVLKGGGWYVTDYGYRKGVSENAPAASSESSPSGSSESSPSVSSSETAAPSAPAPAAPAST